MNCNCTKVVKLDAENNESTTKKLPDEIIFHILTFLPLSCLFKFKSVCKLWNTIFLHPHFSYIYDLRDFRLQDVKYKYCSDDLEGVRFTRISQSSQGLELEKTSSVSSPLMYRIWFPVVCQFLAIPNPQNPSLCMTLEFVPSNQAVKLVSVYADGQSLGYEILALVIGMYQNTYTWRAIKVPPPYLQKHNCEPNGKRKRIQLFFRRELAYSIWHVEKDDDLDIEVDVLDMVNESYIGHTTFPRGFSSKLSGTNLLDWNGCLSFAQLVLDELHVLVLDDYKELKWAETKRIIKLTFLKPDNKELFLFTCFDKSLLFFKGKDKNILCGYDIYTGMLYKWPIPIDSADEVAAVIVAQLKFLSEDNCPGINGVF